jgi:putative ABC transport system permease protein
MTRWVILRSIVIEAGESLRGRRMQATLSAFGIATGIAAVVLLVALVSGVHRMALQQFNRAGGNVISVAAEPDPSARDPRGATMALYESDADAIVRASPYFDAASVTNSASAVVRGVEVPGSTWIVDRNTGRGIVRPGTRAYTVSIRGYSPAGFALNSLTISDGRLPSPAEFESAGRVAVLGPQVARQVFGSESAAVGRSIILGDWPFVVVGVLDWVGNPEGEFRSGLDQVVYMPFRTVAEVFRGTDVAATLALRLRVPGTGDRAVADARGILNRRQTRLGETSGRIAFTSPADRLTEFSLVINGLKLLVAMVGGIALFVGAVGVANVMLVSVRERTHEIGVRRAIGAKRQDIFLGFLCESLALTMAGGMIGIFTAWLLTLVARLFPIPAGAEPHISLVTAATAVSLLVIVGILAGVGPARRAAAIFPAEALRAD